MGATVEKKSKRRNELRLVPDGDPEIFNRDLDWYHGCFDAECGLRSAEGGIADSLADGAARARQNSRTAPSCDLCGRPTARAAVGLECAACGHTQAAQVVPVKHGGGGGASSDIYDDSCVRFKGEGEGTFTRGRRIHMQLRGLPYQVQRDIQAIYESQRTRAKFPEARIRAVHRAYLEAAANV